MGRKRSACDLCASIKTLCSRGRPCARCKRLSLECSYLRSTAPLPDTTVSVLLRNTTKVGYTRSATGCINCRRRRKKCDEQQPTCGDCHRRQLRCVPRSTAQSRPRSSSSSVIQPIANPAEMEPTSCSIEPQLDVATHERTFDSWALSFTDSSRKEPTSSVQESAISDWIALIGFDDPGGMVKPVNLANSTALVDLPVPSAADGEDSRARFLPSTALNNLAGVNPQALTDWTFGERHLLNHFLQSVSRTLVVVGDEDNPFLRVIVPIAVENPTVRHSVLAISACHLSKVYPEFERDLLVHRNLALQRLKAELTVHGTSECTLAATLLLCLLEVGTPHQYYDEENSTDKERYPKAPQGNGYCTSMVQKHSSSISIMLFFYSPRSTC